MTSTSNALRRKLVVVGDGACGKTSLLCVFAKGEFPTQYEPTIFENYVAEIRLDGKPVQLALWDTAGQEGYERLRPLSYAQAHVILIAFSLDSPDSLENAQYKWSEEVRQICGSHIPILLVGCKADLRNDSGFNPSSGFVNAEQAKIIASNIGARSYHECSALRNEGVDVSNLIVFSLYVHILILLFTFCRISLKRPHELPCWSVAQEVAQKLEQALKKDEGKAAVKVAEIMWEKMVRVRVNVSYYRKFRPKSVKGCPIKFIAIISSNRLRIPKYFF